MTSQSEKYKIFFLLLLEKMRAFWPLTWKSKSKSKPKTKTKTEKKKRRKWENDYTKSN